MNAPIQVRNGGEWGEWRTDSHGYVVRSRTKNNVTDWQQQHRVVMIGILGRELFPGENVHHINGVRNDNRPENLELWVTRQPAGQRPSDLLDWADEIIARYREMPGIEPG